MNTPAAAAAALDYFVDEAGDPAVFGARGRVLVGNPGCSRYLMLGVLQVADPAERTV